MASSRFPDPSPEKLDKDALRDVRSAYENVVIALGDPALRQETRNVLETAKTQLKWVGDGR